MKNYILHKDPVYRWSIYIDGAITDFVSYCYNKNGYGEFSEKYIFPYWQGDEEDSGIGYFYTKEEALQTLDDYINSEEDEAGREPFTAGGGFILSEHYTFEGNW